MSDVVQLGEVRSEPVPAVVRVLEEALEEARAGRIRAVGVFGQMSDGGTMSALALSEGGIDEMNLALDRLKIHMLSDTVVDIVDRA